MRKRCSVLAPLILLCLVPLTLAPAQVVLFGTISDATTGPLLSGTTYFVTSSINVNGGDTLTIQRGAVVKFASGTSLNCDGTLLEVLPQLVPPSTMSFFTSADDDAVGLDVTPGTQTSGSPGEWNGILFQGQSDATLLRNLHIRFAGSNQVPTLTLIQADITLENVIVSDGLGTAMDCTATSQPFVTNSAFNTHNRTVDVIPAQGISRFINCTATGNVEGDPMRPTGPAFLFNGAFVDIDVANTFNQNGVVLFVTPIVVFAGVTFDVGPGVTIKINGNNQIDVTGTFTCLGTTQQPVTLTSSQDDAIGGDSTGNGASTVAPGQWSGINFRTTSDASILRHTNIRGSGSNTTFGAILCEEADVLIEDVTLDGSLGSGLDLNSNSLPVVTNLTMSNIVGVAVDRSTWDSMASFTNVTCTGPGPCVVRVSAGSIFAPLVLSKADTVNQNGIIVYTTGLTISSTRSLTLGSGMVLKNTTTNFRINVSGVLNALGTDSDPVVFTSAADDGEGGDSTGDGPTTGAAGNWRGVNFGVVAGVSTIRHARIKFCGSQNEPCVTLGSNSAVTFESVAISQSTNAGIDVNGHPVIVRGCSFTQLLVPMLDVTFTSISQMGRNTASGCTQGHAIRQMNAAIGAGLTIRRENLLDDSIITPLGFTIGAAESLTFGPGVIVKLPATRSVSVIGTFTSLGTGSDKVVFTSTDDDAIGGDADGNGPTVGVPGTWNRVRVETTALLGSRFDHVVVRFAGGGGNSGFQSFVPIQSMDGFSAQHCIGRGINLAAPCLSDIDNLLVHHCGADGIRIDSGTTNLVFATIANNGGVAIDDATWTGKVISSIAFQNGNGSSNTLVASDVLTSNGFAFAAGMNGNIDADPLFVDAANGDYSLQAASPCLDVASLVESDRVTSDQLGRSRALDATLTMAAMPDMGAIERARYTLAATRDFRSGDTFAWRVDGDEPGFTFLLLGPGGAQYAANFGYLNVGTESTIFTIDVSTVGATSFLPVVFDPSLLGAEFRLQAVAISTLSFPRGNFTEFISGKLFD